MLASWNRNIAWSDGAELGRDSVVNAGRKPEMIDNFMMLWFLPVGLQKSASGRMEFPKEMNAARRFPRITP